MLEQIPPNSIEHLYGPEQVPYAEDELVLLCLLRDGRPYLKSFLEHHFSMGVKHLFFLDNGSTDGTVEALKEYENVTVLHTGLPFERYELSMRQYLVERFCREGRWCLYADMDELFDYPYSDVVSLGSLLRYLNERSYTAVVAQMLDMFPEEPLSGRASNPDEPLKQRHRFYDISNVQAKGIREHRPARNNTYESDDIEAFYSGLRNTLFGTKKFLTRFALMFSDGRVKPFAGSGHWVDEARVADLTCVLFHYKFLDGYLRKKAAEGLGDQQHWNTSHYNKYLKALDSNLSLQLKQESARELRSVNDLVENHFLVVSEEYMMLVYDEEERKKGGDHAPRRGGPGGGPQDEAAFDRTRAQAKIQTLRAKRLQRRLQDLTELHQSELQKLREHNQREVDKLRGQYQRRIEKLNYRLARTKKKTKKKNRALMKQLRSIRASRSWRLLNKLARLRAKVLRRNATKQGAP